MIIDENKKEFDELFRSLKNTDRDMLVIEDFKNRMKSVQGKFEENE